MRLTTVAPALLAAVMAVHADLQRADIFLQPLGSSSLPIPLAEVSYDLGALDTESAASISAQPALELPESTGLVRVGLYDVKQQRWTGSTSVASAENFRTGYDLHFVLSVDGTTAGEETVLGASVRGVRVGTGKTRQLGPQVRLSITGKGKQPELNRPVLLSPDGKKVEKEEKTFLQKYWWLIGIAVMLAMGGGGGGGGGEGK